MTDIRSPFPQIVLLTAFATGIVSNEIDKMVMDTFRFHAAVRWMKMNWTER
jgi:hypothetical protein